eukprot:Tamp_36371.p1 GENE.Tamp_36371~~Tamp_36371.p1  ORF type:complete len:177 (-),score=17.51 Tamp_36371:25-519(-)
MERGSELDDFTTEMLRIVSPVTRAYRQVAADFTYKGIDMKKGQQVQFNLAAANLDPRVFPPDPEAFRADRTSSGPSHLAFGFRDHLCPGLNLGRRTTKAALSALATRFPNLELAVPRADVCRLDLESINALKALPIRVSGRPSEDAAERSKVNALVREFEGSVE